MTFKEITKFFIENTDDEELKRNLNPSWALKSLSSLNPARTPESSQFQEIEITTKPNSRNLKLNVKFYWSVLKF